MVSFLSRLAAFASIFVFVGQVASVPLNETAVNGLDNQARDVLACTTPAAPHFVVYGDAFVSGLGGPPAPSEIKPPVILLPESPRNKAQEWISSMTDAERSAIKAQYAAAGIKLLISAFGSMSSPTTTNTDPIIIANNMSYLVKFYNLDGIDIDYQDFSAMDASDGKAEDWLISFTKQLCIELPQDTYILTHAPAVRWFTPNRWGRGGYLKVHQSVGNLIDWYNVQFYDFDVEPIITEGATEYNTCTNLLTQSTSTWQQSSVFEMAANGIPLDKIVIRKPATASNASNGFMSTSTLASCLQQAKNQGWTGGAMAWEYPGANLAWITAVRASSWPV